MEISKQYIGYYAKNSLFNLKGSKSKVTKMELELKSVFSGVVLIPFVMLNNTNKRSYGIRNA